MLTTSALPRHLERPSSLRPSRTRHRPLPWLAWVGLVAALALVTPGSVHGDGFILVARPPVVLPGPRPHSPLEVIRHHVSIQVRGGMAEVLVTETFRNPVGHELEGTYIFPLPPEAAVEEFRATLGGVELAGEVLERDQARTIYEQLVRGTRDPALLEYYDRGLFRARVFPIPPYGDLPLTLRYRQLLPSNGDLQRLRYPLDTGRFSAGPYHDVRIVVDVETDQPLRALASPSHPATVERLAGNRARLQYVAGQDPARKDFLVDILTSRESLAAGVRSFREPGEDGFFQLRLAPGLTDSETCPQGTRAVIFVIDTSGSMAGDKLTHARRALHAALARLSDQDRFQIITFSSRLRSFARGLVLASPAEKQAAAQFVDSLVARGGTDLAGAVLHALELAGQGILAGQSPMAGPGTPGESLEKSGGQVSILLATDGAPTVGVTDVQAIVSEARRRNGGDHHLHVFGLGHDVNTVLLDSLARANRGSRSYLAEAGELEVAIGSTLDKVLLPSLSGLSVRCHGAVVDRLEPSTPLDLFHGEDLVITGRYRGDGGPCRFEISADLAGVRREFSVACALASHGGDEGVAYLWAHQTILRLLGELRDTAVTDQQALRAQIVALGLRFGIVTPYTSFLVREQDAGPVSAQLLDRIRVMPEGKRALDRTAAGFSAPAGEDSFDYAQRQELLEKRARQGRIGVGGDDGAFGRLGIVQRGGRAFLPTSDRLVDGALQGAELPVPDRTLSFGSAEYFAFLRENPGTATLFGAGRSLLLRWGSEIIEVREGALRVSF